MKRNRTFIGLIIIAALLLQAGLPAWPSLSGQAEAASSGPVLVSMYPANGSSGIPGNTNLKLTFDEPVAKGAASAYIHVRRVDTNEEVSAIAANSSAITLNATGYMATVTLPANLTVGLSYYVRVDQGAFVNVSNGANYAGLNDATAWRFEVAAADTAAPTASVYSPAAGGTDVSPSTPLTITFNEPVYASNGYVTIARTGGDTQNIDVGSASVTGSGTTMISITPDLPLQASSEYTVNVPAGAFKDAAGNSYAGIAAWKFQTSVPPMIVSTVPANNSMGASRTDDLVMTVTNMQALAKGTGKITIKRIGDNSQFQQLDVSSPDVTVAGNVVSIKHAELEANKSYYVLADPGTFMSGNTVYQGINDASTWTFSTASGIDSTAPTATALTPVNGGVLSVLSASLVIKFDEPVYPSSGTIVIKNSATNAIFQTILITSSNVKGGGTNTITIDHNAFVNNTSYYVEVSSQAFRDLAGNYYTGIASAAGWSFRVTSDTAPPVISTLAPVNGANNVAVGSALSVLFNEPIQVLQSMGSAVINRANSTSGAILANLSVDATDARKLIVTPQAALAGSMAYYVEIADSAVADLAGNKFAGIQNTGQWTFSTVGTDRTAPTLSSAAMSGASAIVLTYSENLDTASVPSVSNFYVTVNDDPRTVTSVLVSGKTVTVTLSSGIIFGQTVKLTYTKGTKPIQDLSANPAASLSAISITNTADTTLPKPISGTANGNVVLLNFNQSLATLSPYAFTQFTVKVNGTVSPISEMQVYGTLLYITLSNSAASGVPVSVSYTQGSYPLYDLNGNAVQTFANYYVTNGADSTAPVLQSITASGYTVTLNYNEGLNTSYVPAKSAYSVLGGGTARTISSVSVASNQVVLTMANNMASVGTVLVTYVPSASTAMALRDLSGNQAAGFSGVQANGSSTSQVTAATVNSLTLSLAFGETLNASYVPRTSQFTVKVNGIVSPVANVMMNGATVTLTLYTAVASNAVVTVNYTSDQSGLRNLTGTLISSFTDQPVSNQTPAGSTGGGGGFEASPEGAVLLQPSHYTLSSTLSPGGQLVNQYNVLEESLNNAYKAARSMNASTPKVQLTIPSSEKAGVAAIPLQALENAKNVGGAPVIVVQYGDITYEIPCAALDYSAIAKALNVGGTTGHLVVKIDKSAQSLTYNLTSAVNRAGAVTYVSPVEFEVDVTAGGVVKEWPSFSQYVTRSAVSSTTISGRQAAVVWFDPATGVLSYVPTKVTDTTNGSKISFMRKGNSAYAVIKGNITYSDMGTHWARNSVLLMANKYIVEGRSSTKFEPNKPITRGEFAMFIARGLGLSGDKAAAAAFSDLNANTALAAYIGAVSKAGIVLGNADGTFKPNSFITRQEAAAMLNRAAAAAGANVSLPQTTDSYIQRFKDRNQIGLWARGDVAKSVYTGFITGTTSTTFNPLSNTTRAEATIMIQRMLVYVGFLQQ